MIVLHKLPEIKETLWLRLLGKGRKQLRAIQSVMELPEADPDRDEVIKLIVSWKVTIERSGAEILTELPEELKMVLSQVYLEWEAKTEQQGVIRVALNMLKERIPHEQIARLTGLTLDQIQQLQSSDQP